MMSSRRTSGCAALAAVLMFVAATGAPARADQDDPRLDQLFGKLQRTDNASEVAAITDWIWRIWVSAEDEAVDRLLQQGIYAMSHGSPESALQFFDQVVERAPGFAEGWNKRATARFLVGDYDGSIADIERTLALEPRHFGALSGLGMIAVERAEDERALEAFEGALAVNPHLEHARREVNRLRRKLHGAAI